MIANDNIPVVSAAFLASINQPSLTELRIGAISYPVGILFKSQWAILKECWEAIGKGSATRDQAWPFRGLFYLLQAGDPEFDMTTIKLAEITSEHVNAANCEIIRQLRWSALLQSAMMER